MTVVYSTGKQRVNDQSRRLHDGSYINTNGSLYFLTQIRQNHVREIGETLVSMNEDYVFVKLVHLYKITKRKFLFKIANI